MKILGIDTSCDDTSVALVEASGPKQKPEFNILSNVVSSQIKVHKKWGGVVPMLAKREHQKNLTAVLRRALSESGMLEKTRNAKRVGRRMSNNGRRTSILENILKREQCLSKRLKTFLTKYEKPDIDLIAVTTGPGLEPCLWVGVNFAKAIAYWWNLPIVPVNHVEAHIAANLLPQISGISNFQFLISKQTPISNNRNLKRIKFPAVCLVVSGGHTRLILMKAIGKYELLGETRDDAAGECLDKAAKILGLGYPGGPAIAVIAAKSKIKSETERETRKTSETRETRKTSETKVKAKIYSLFHDRGKVSINDGLKLPRPMIYQKNYDFSFSGLKTAILYDFKKRSSREKKAKKYIQAMCFEIQQAIIDVLIHKTLKAAKERGAKTIILAGGVAANKELRKQIEEKIKKEFPDVSLFIPDPILCTDNAAMVGAAGYEQWIKGENMVE